MVDLPVLVLKVLLVLGRIIPFQFFPQLIVHSILMFYPGKSIGRVFPVETISGQDPLFFLLLLLPGKMLAQVMLLSAVRGLALKFQTFPDLRQQTFIRPKALLQRGQSILKVSVFLLCRPEVALPADPFLIDPFLYAGQLSDPLLQQRLLCFQLCGQRTVFQFFQFLRKLLLLIQINLQLSVSLGKTQKLFRTLVQLFQLLRPVQRFPHLQIPDLPLFQLIDLLFQLL